MRGAGYDDRKVVVNEPQRIPRRTAGNRKARRGIYKDNIHISIMHTKCDMQDGRVLSKKSHWTIRNTCENDATGSIHLAVSGGPTAIAYVYFAMEDSMRLLTFCYLAALNCWLLLCPATLSHDWQMGSVPLVASLADTRNLATCLFFGGCLILTYKAFMDFEVSLATQT
ncbi:Transmembrane and TPR repeat-containing protein 2 [Eufriesea mexicana]|uniref:Transmembrane and TPR repeat-containing protein 2 n=1 Tax=Eufriesea mexicana TaxID=516756 RepID=A0A310SUJ9_9HYME|nr:Transmembrane and TPR repeat-containing protein 2 [Eufriesea mexicana]